MKVGAPLRETLALLAWGGKGERVDTHPPSSREVFKNINILEP